MENLEELLAEARKRYHTKGMKIKSKYGIQGELLDPDYYDVNLVGFNFKAYPEYSPKTIVEWDTSNALWFNGEWAETDPPYVDKKQIELNRIREFIYKD